MFNNGRRRGLFVALATVGAAIVAAAGVLGTNVARGATTAGGMTGASAAATKTVVPWKSVGPRWVLDTYSTRTTAKAAPATLYLISPAGAKYPLYTWKASKTLVPLLVAWAGNKTEALFQLYSPENTFSGYGELNLLTGKMTRIAFANPASSTLSYTLPAGQQLLGSTANGKTATVARYTRAGALVKTLLTESSSFTNGFPLTVKYSPSGAELGVGAPNGLLLASNAGGVLRKLPVPGTDTRIGCVPVRWWNTATILASCMPANTNAERLWLVPVSGARPSALTPVRNPAKAPNDNGDIDAWRLPSGLYLQSLGACGTLELNKQAANGSITRVTVPGMADSPVVVTAAGARLLVEQLGCDGAGGQLAWYNPATKAEQWLLRSGAGEAVAYNDPQNGAIS
jgi:TolB protein